MRRGANDGASHSLSGTQGEPRGSVWRAGDGHRGGSVFVYVVSVLVGPVTIVQVFEVIIVLHGFAAISGRVVFVLDRVAAVSR